MILGGLGFRVLKFKGSCCTNVLISFGLMRFLLRSLVCLEAATPGNPVPLSHRTIKGGT